MQTGELYLGLGGDGVVELTPSNFDKLVMKGDEVWMIEFYANR